MRVLKLACASLLAATVAFAPVMLQASSASATSPALALKLTNANNGASISVPPGTYVYVDLTGSVSNGDLWRWTVPASSNNAVLTFESGGTDAQGDAWAEFLAAAGGTARITSQESCSPASIVATGGVCPQIVLLWQVSVSVVPTPTA